MECVLTVKQLHVFMLSRMRSLCIMITNCCVFCCCCVVSVDSLNFELYFCFVEGKIEIGFDRRRSKYST